jgi:GNAT superfamily N-acetyltransferase
MHEANEERPLWLRPSTTADDAVCGRLVGRAASRSIMARRLPFARAYLGDRSPLVLERTHDRLVAGHGSAEIVGLAQFCRADRYLWYLFVEPARQGAGVGSALLAAVEDTIGYPVRLRTLAINETALKFYLRRGYRVRSGWVEDGWHGGSVVWLELEKKAPVEERGSGRFD